MSDSQGTASDEKKAGYPRKRARTRRQLITAGMDVLARRGPDGATVGEIASEARVATGTFYNHFPSMMDLVETITDELQIGVEIASATLESIDNDAATRVVIGARQLIALSETDPIAARAFTSLMATIPTFRLRIRRVVERAIRAGVESESFSISNTTAATDAVVGTVLQWIRSDLAGDTGDATFEDRATIVLQLLGVDRERIGATIAAAGSALRTSASDASPRQ